MNFVSRFAFQLTMLISRSRPNQEPDAKKLKTDQRKAPGQDIKKVGPKMIELDFLSADEEL